MTSLIEDPAATRLGTTRGLLQPGRRAGRRDLHRRCWPYLGMIALAQIGLSRLVGGLDTPFQDEGLYIYMGHRFLESVTGGLAVFESPGSYFSGAPWFYPVLAALVDDFGGLSAVRDLSLVFMIGAMFGTFGIARHLFSPLAGVLAAATFAVSGPVIFLSQWATFDALALMLAALAGWLTLTSARREGLLLAPVVAVILAAATLTKYAGVMFVPVLAALAIAVGWSRFRWAVVGRAVFMALATMAILFFVVILSGRDLVSGILQTTADRTVLYPAGTAVLLGRVALWIGPWLVLAAIAASLHLRRRPGVALLLLGGALIAPAQQIHLGEGTSLNKHLAFGLIFAAPLIGDLAARLVSRRAVLTFCAALGIGGLLLHGIHFAGQFRTDYTDDRAFGPFLQQAIAANPGKPLLAEQSAAQRYELRTDTDPRQWIDTYGLTYAGETGLQAYRRAIDEHYFGVIYLNYTTPAAGEISKMLQVQGPHPYYKLCAKVRGEIHGEPAGYWLMWAPQDVRYTSVE